MSDKNSNKNISVVKEEKQPHPSSQFSTPLEKCTKEKPKYNVCNTSFTQKTSLRRQMFQDEKEKAHYSRQQKEKTIKRCDK